MSKIKTGALSAACALAIVAVGALAVAAGPSVQPIALAAEQIIAARQASLDMSVMTISEMKIAARDGTDVTKQVYPANTLARWAKALPTLFPTGTGMGATTMVTHAKPEIWTDRAGFEKAAADYAAAADRLSALAQAGDTAGFKEQVEAVARTCGACHSNYKAE